MAMNIPIWPGSSSFFPGDTPFGFYDNDPEFQCEADAIAEWASRRLGWPLTDIELQAVNFYTAFEEAITEYGNQVNTYSARDNLIHLLGFDTGSINYAGRYIPSTLKSIIKLASQYGTEVGAGGTSTYYTGSIHVVANRQVYDFLSSTDVTLETGSFSQNTFTIRRIFHESTPSIVKYFDPSLGTGIGTQNMLEQFGFGSYSVPGNFLVMPLYNDALRMQAIELNDQIRKSAYSFQITNNRLRIFPIPNSNFTMYFYYTLDDQGIPGQGGTPINAGVGKISDFSNIPYFNISYRHINDMGKQWIRKYTLALCKEMLGRVRGKYAAMPIPDGEVTLNGSELISEAQGEKDKLIEQLQEILDQMSRQSQMERKVAEAEQLQTQLKHIPLKIYVR
jgi:hypothetical protein